MAQKNNTQKPKKKGGAGKALAVGAGVAAAGAAVYMLLGPDGKKNRAKVKKFVGKVKRTVAANKDLAKMAGALKKGMAAAKKAAKSGAKKMGQKMTKKVAKKVSKK